MDPLFCGWQFLHQPSHDINSLHNIFFFITDKCLPLHFNLVIHKDQCVFFVPLEV